MCIRTGEEEETEQFSAKAKLYRFDSDSNEWKERGVGPLKVLQHVENKLMRVLMRRDKTLKICANHLVAPGTQLSSHMDNEKCFVWSAMDYADEEPKPEMFCIRYGNDIFIVATLFQWRSLALLDVEPASSSYCNMTD